MLISGTYDDLFEQAKDTAAFLLRRGHREIDNMFGEGYAKHHPELLAAYMLTASSEFRTATTQNLIQDEMFKLIEANSRNPSCKRTNS